MKSVFILCISILLSVLTACEPRPVDVAAISTQRVINADSESQNWLVHGRTYDEQRFSLLDDINDSTIKQLGLAWYLDLGTDRGLEGTPIVVDGVIYISGSWNIIYAINAQTGDLIWHFDPQTSRSWVAAHSCCDAVSRGVAVWDGKVLAATLDGRLLALDAHTGEQLWSTLTIDRKKPYTITGAPRVIKGKVIIGNSGADYGVRGYISAYDANTGELDWRFYTVPGDPAQPQENAVLEMAAKTWHGEEWYKTGGGGTAWNAMAFDPELNLLYFGVGNGTPWSRELRSPGGGDNLFLSSIIAVNPDNGEYVWHYQTTPGESWNFSAVESMVLTELMIDEQPRKVLIQAPKNGFFYVLDRATGELLSAEKYIDQNWASHVDLETGRPVEYPFARYKEQGRLVVPGPSGGHSWHPMSYSPLTKLAYIPALSVPGYYNHHDSYSYKPGFQNTGIEEGVANYRALNPQGKRQKLHFGVRLLAWDPQTQTERWRVEHADLGGGTLATAGNLVFQGLGSGEFSAYAADSGNKLWSFEAGTTIMAGPVSYAVADEQYILVLAGRGGGSGLVGGPTGKRWNGLVNENRILAFKLGGTVAIPAARQLQRVVNIPEELLLESEDKELVGQGKKAYEQYCYMCHGLGVTSGGVIADLRYASPKTFSQWQAIVIAGSRADRGMRSFAEVLSVDDSLAIRAYVLERASRLR
ncbi:MAG: PQQ-dependent dehydrogenase, methanol/ethanol family [Gammaproteobacteria bacterium]|nr:PQQ-dependent dehydrogenase, methanol/ethanol family [Gammaproteobacteria bacterium]MCP4088325.1 PQQ-dependent dehydrogenase, methanol/ethanol family [Gammaproteobacteria bacterium]MCP4276364.1 PQQ-dependent dehydrogenase, methanol/ethanol family [Gammaproteobacteria bacterium]MCP4831011.1 PQQ-dependent dehydrogenase, methanol/ethanol family [Gammaproteobacteria bacterium]MCP4927468.1 PQQ-dependent dehydrogenase, methanol/ethanol family [Gammaproteobacteria bacterium]